MSKGQDIILTAEPKGQFEEIVVSGTPKPGTLMEIVPSTNPVSGRFTMRAVSRADGAKGPICILVPDREQGQLFDTAYVTATRGFVYWPVAGEEFNMFLRRQAGTGTSLNENIGDLLEVDGATGMLQGIGTGGPTGAHASAPFQLLEHLGVALTGDTLIWVKYLGNNA